MAAHPTPETIALVALGEDVSSGVLDHIGSCEHCFAEVASFQQVIAVGRSLGPDDRLVSPHPRVWDRIAHTIHDGRVIPLPGAVTLRGPTPVVPPAESDPVPLGGLAARTADVADGRAAAGSDVPPTSTGRRPLRRQRWFVTALAAAAALVVGLGGGFVIKGLLNPTPDVVSATQLNALPSYPGANGTAAVEKDASGRRTLVVTMEMPAELHPVGVYDVWMSDSRAQNMVKMGEMNGLSSRFPIPTTVDLAANPIIDVSLEPTDDPNPAKHSEDSVLRGRLKL